MLITLMLWDSGVIAAPHFYISGYLEENKDRYIDSMRSVSKNSNWTDWCAFFMEALEQQAIRNFNTADHVQNLYEDMKIKFRDILASKWNINALDFVFTNPILRNSKFTKSSGIPASTAARFTRLLVKQEILNEIQPGSGRRSGLYIFEPLMRLVRV